MRRMQTLLELVIATIGILTLGVIVVLAFYAHPMGDDFCNAANVREVGVLRAVVNEYLEWGGRWSAHALVVGFPALLDVTRWYFVGPLAAMAVAPLATHFLLGGVFPALRSDRRLAFTLTLGFLVLYVSGMPHPGQSLLWFEGAATYSLNVWAALVVVGGLLRLSPTPSSAWSRWGAVTGLAALSLLVAACHELFAMALLTALVAGAALGRVRGDVRARAWALCALVCAAGLASVALAPGNEAREASYGVTGSPARALYAAAAMWWRVLDAPVLRGEPTGPYSPLAWFLDVKLLAASALFVTSARVQALRPAWVERDPWLWKLLFPAATLAILTGAFLAGGWALGRTLPLRAFDGLYVIFLLGWFLTLLAVSRGEPGARPHPALPGLRVACAALLALGLAVSPNLKQGLRDLAQGRPQHVDREMKKRYEDARQARAAGARELVVHAIEPWPTTFFRQDLGEIRPVLLACAARFFEVDEIRVVSPAGRSERHSGADGGP